jgi:hypothetical protein
MKATRSILTSVVPTMVVMLLACLPLFAMVPILANSRESQALDVQPLDIEPARVPTPPPVIDQQPVAAAPAPTAVANALAPQPIPVPMPPVAATHKMPSMATAESPELAPAVTLPTAHPISVMVLIGLLAVLWARLHRAPSPCSLREECA